MYGNGTVAFTARLCAEIVGIPFDKLGEVSEFIGSGNSGLTFGGTGNQIRPVTACKGTTCVYGCCDTQELARKLHEQFYLGKRKMPLPHKFKIAVGGCPNSCMKPSLNDFGIEARRGKDKTLFQIYVGGTWGRHTRVGTPLSCLVTGEVIFPVLHRTIGWFADNARPKERLGGAIERIGIGDFERALWEKERG